MYAGVSEAEKNVREGGRDKGSISVPHNRVTDRQGYKPSLRILMAACSLATQTL